MFNSVWLVIGFLSSYVVSFTRLFVYNVALDRSCIKQFYKTLKEKKPFEIVFTDGVSNNEDHVPIMRSSFVFWKTPFFLVISENTLQGTHYKEMTCSITTLFFFKSSINKILRSSIKTKVDDTITISIAFKDYYNFATLIPTNSAPYKNLIIDKPIFKGLFNLFNEVKSGKRRKSGIILYGPPGNGKTSIIKTFGVNLGFDINIISFNASLDNPSLYSLFAYRSDTKRPRIIVFEDFDCVFDGRKPLIDGCHLTYDGILNVIDGILIDNDKTMLIITANDMSKIDNALKSRPSRIDSIVHIENPSTKSRRRILKKYCNHFVEDFVHVTEGCSASLVCEIGKRDPKSVLEVEETIMEFKQES